LREKKDAGSDPPALALLLRPLASAVCGRSRRRRRTAGRTEEEAEEEGTRLLIMLLWC
jgi:hypothetical protein